MRPHAIVVLSALALLACTTSKVVVADTETASPTATSSGAPRMDAPPSERNPPVAAGALPLGDVNLTKAVGDPCDAPSSAHCGTRGRIAFAVRFVTHGFGAPQGGEPVTPCKTQPLGTTIDHMTARAACELDGRVYVKNDCVVCRMPSGTVATAVVAEMTDPQLQAAQKMAGLAPEPLLRTREAWQEALRHPPKPPRATQN